ncbi:hypothetical protein D3C86_1393560 [compost metagenome]
MSDVAKTNPKANSEIGLFHFQKSFHEVYQAASYKSGGRKIRNTNSGSSSISGIPGRKLIIKPAMTKKIGYAIFIFFATITIMKTENKSASINSKL